MEQSFVMVKPDGVQRGLVGEVISRFERKGYKLSAMKMLQLTREKAETHYAEHIGKSFFEPLVEFIISGPVVAMVWEGDDVVAGVRRMLGATKPNESFPGTIRGDFGITMNRNIVHASDSPTSAVREIGVFFNNDELVSYDKVIEKWIYPAK